MLDTATLETGGNAGILILVALGLILAFGLLTFIHFNTGKLEKIVGIGSAAIILVLAIVLGEIFLPDFHNEENGILRTDNTDQVVKTIKDADPMGKLLSNRSKKVFETPCVIVSRENKVRTDCVIVRIIDDRYEVWERQAYEAEQATTGK